MFSTVFYVRKGMQKQNRAWNILHVRQSRKLFFFAEGGSDVIRTQAFSVKENYL